MSRYVAMQPLVPGKRVDILERNDAGHLIGAWFGYWNYNRGVVTLYPNVTNHAVNWPGGRAPGRKRNISIRLVDYKKNTQRRSVVTQKNEAPGDSKGETWRDRKLPMKGQERMKF